MSRVVALVASIALSACSYTFQSKPSRTEPVVANDCSTSLALPIVDTIGAVAGAVVVGYGLSDQEHKDWPMAAAGIALIPTLIYAASAVEGYRAALHCERIESPQRAALR